MDFETSRNVENVTNKAILSFEISIFATKLVRSESLRAVGPLDTLSSIVSKHVTPKQFNLGLSNLFPPNSSIEREVRHQLVSEWKRSSKLVFPD